MTLQLPGADPWNGASSTAISVYGTYVKPTVVRITASGMHSRAPNFPVIEGGGSWGPSGNAAVVVGASGISIVDGGGGATATVYATVTGNVTRGQRYGYDERQYTGYPPGTYCGRIYDAMCDTWSGQTIITLTRLVSDLAVTADSTTVSPGSTPYFDYRPSPAVVEGRPMQAPLDSTHWVPDADSLGGDPEEAAVHAYDSGACQPGYGTACRRKIIGSGTFTVSAWVNGKWIQKAVHISAPSLRLAAAPKSVGTGDTVVFTASWSDSFVLDSSKITSWSWVADLAPGTTVACGAGVATCRRPVGESGTMIVRVTRGGVTRAARVHVTVVPCATSNPLLNDPEIRSGFMDLYNQSRFDVAPGTGYTTGDEYSGTKKEQGGFIFGRPDGSYYVVEDTLALATECRVDIHAANWMQYLRAPTDTLVGFVHTHPTRAGEPVYGCGDVKDSAGNVLVKTKRWPGDNEPGREETYVGDQWSAGGGSSGDWTIGVGLVDGYVLNADGELWRLPKEGADDPALRVPNFSNMTSYRFNMLAICDW